MIKGIAILGGFAALLVTSSSGNAQHWCDTQQQLNEAERTVCSSPRLREQDRWLDHHYRRSNVSTESEREWIKQRNRCGNDESCLTEVYTKRDRELQRSHD